MASRKIQAQNETPLMRCQGGSIPLHHHPLSPLWWQHDTARPVGQALDSHRGSGQRVFGRVLVAQREPLYAVYLLIVYL